MNRLIQPLSEHFLYCSPEAMDRQLYRLSPVPRGKSDPSRKKRGGRPHGNSRTG